MELRARFTSVRWFAPLLGVAALGVGAGRAEADPALSVSVIVLDDVVACDHDGFLDSDEVGRAVVTVSNPSHRDVLGARVTVKPLVDALDVDDRGGLFVGKIPAFGSTWVEATLKLNAKPDGQVGLRAEVIAPAGGEIGGSSVDAFFAADVDDVANGAWFDDVSGAESGWTPEYAAPYGAASRWRRGLDEYSDPVWYVEGSELGADSTLTSPSMAPAHNQDFIFRFSQRYDFGDQEDVMTSGAVVELTTDGGRTWQDAYDYIDVPYTGSMGEHASALECRRAFVGRSVDLPGRQVVALNFGDIFQGETLQVRFRMASEGPVKGAGWELDDFEVEGAYLAPFPARVPHRGQCVPPATFSGRATGLQAHLPAQVSGSSSGGAVSWVSGGALAQPATAWADESAVLGLVLPEQDDRAALPGARAETAAVPSLELVRAPIGRVYGGQVEASGCTALGGPEAASPLALVLVLMGGAFVARRRK
jgi:hypothetical protein